MNRGRGLFWPESFRVLFAEYGGNIYRMSRDSGLHELSLRHYAHGVSKPMKEVSREAFVKIWGWGEVELPEKISIAGWPTEKDRGWQELLYWFATGLSGTRPPESRKRPGHSVRMVLHEARVQGNSRVGNELDGRRSNGRTSHARRTA